MLAKENPRPGQIQRQLHQEQSKRPTAPRRRRRQPNPPRREGHQSIKQRPYRPKHPVRWRNCRARKRAIPSAYLAGCPSPANARHSKTHHEPEDQRKPTHGCSPFLIIPTWSIVVPTVALRKLRIEPNTATLALDFAPSTFYPQELAALLFIPRPERNPPNL